VSGNSLMLGRASRCILNFATAGLAVSRNGAAASMDALSIC
jgi:hypothetical protein